MFGEANSIEKRHDIYGRRVMASLAYVSALMGDLIKAKMYLELFEREYGQTNVKDDKEYERILLTR